jgi:hypothetical protein
MIHCSDLVAAQGGALTLLRFLAAHGSGFGRNPGNFGTVDADIRPFPVGHFRKLAPCPVVDGLYPAPLCAVGPELLERIVESLEGMDGEDVLKCHVSGLSFQMVEFDPPRIANNCIWLILDLHANRHWTLSVQRARVRSAPDRPRSRHLRE